MASEQPQFIASTGNQSHSNELLIENLGSDQIVVPDKKSWRNLFAYIGPGFLVSIAYMDPGNCKTCSFLFKPTYMQQHSTNMRLRSMTQHG
ncbi:hypothetical protein CsSME_00052673 [Camellia sinensis var. sinensis]